MSRTDDDKAVLDWRQRMIWLRQKYAGLPGGYTSEEAAARDLQQLEEDRNAWQAKCHHDFAPEALQRWKKLGSAGHHGLTGREKELDRIKKAFQDGLGPVFLCGIGGIGKTSLAAEYARENEDRYEAILLLTCNDSFREAVCDDTMLPISHLSYSRDLYRDRGQYYREKLKALQMLVKRRRTLLIIDDWNKVDKRYLGTVCGLPCDVLVTSRLDAGQWKRGTAISVPGLREKAEWIHFHRSYFGDAASEEEAFLTWCREVQGHPLMMKMYPGTGFGASGTDIHAFMADLLSRLPLQEQEKRCLCELSVLPIQGMAVKEFCLLSDHSAKVLQTLKEKTLISLSAEEDIVSIHPVIAAAVREIWHPDAKLCRKLITGLGKQVHSCWEHSYRENEAYVPYVRSLLKACGHLSPWMSRTWDELLTLLLMQEYFEEAKEGYERLLSSVTSFYGEEHQITGEVQLRMAAWYFNAQAYEESVPWYEKAYHTLSLCPRYDRSYRYQRFLAASKLSRICRGRHELDQALSYAREALDHYEAYILEQAEADSGHKADSIAQLPDFKAGLGFYFCLMDIGKIHMRAGRMEEAASWRERLWTYLEKDTAARTLLTESFARTEIDKFNLEFLTRSGDISGALKLADQMLAYALENRGEYHSYTMGIRYRRANLLAMSREMKAAQEAYEALLRDLRRYHPEWSEQIGRVEKALRNTVSDTVEAGWAEQSGRVESTRKNTGSDAVEAG